MEDHVSVAPVTLAEPPNTATMHTKCPRQCPVCSLVCSYSHVPLPRYHQLIKYPTQHHHPTLPQVPHENRPPHATRPIQTASYLPPPDFKQAGQIVDDELNRLLIRPLLPGVTLNAVIDACHSGTALDLPFRAKVDSEGRCYWKGQARYDKTTAGGTAKRAAFARLYFQFVMHGCLIPPASGLHP